ncbi:MAG: GntR family transcriptional regulator [Ktedonobacteraceae bacterium]|nr:GntR family transcriptional regulator [Ktedonobacteraceae bacterium]
MAVGKHLALATELERDILAGKYGWEGGLPSASELAQACNLSVNTVKSALAVLEGKNLVEKRGIGYYVCRIPTTMTQYVPPAHIRLHREGFCKNIGSVKRISLPVHVAEKLQIEVHEVVYRVQISGEVVEGNEKPLQIAYRYHLLPVSDDRTQRMQEDATYDPMWETSNPDVPAELKSHDEVAARPATEGERDLLGLPESTPIVYVFETIRDQGNTLLMVQEIILSPRTTLIFDFPFTNRP